MIGKLTYFNGYTPDKHRNSYKYDDEPNIYLKSGVILTSALGVGAALAIIAKKQGFSLKPSTIKNTPVKDWAVFRLFDKKHPDKKTIELEEKEIMSMASASVAGGLLGGAIFDDKKHFKSKLRESVNQILGNVLVPVACVGGASRLYKANKEKILGVMPQLKSKGKFAKNFNKIIKVIPGSVATIVSLGIGIIAGNKVSNFLNEKLFHKKVERNIKGSDFAPHVDDLGMAVSLMADKSKGASFIQRIVPLFLCVPGIEVGTHRDE